MNQISETYTKIFQSLIVLINEHHLNDEMVLSTIELDKVNKRTREFEVILRWIIFEAKQKILVLRGVMVKHKLHDTNKTKDDVHKALYPGSIPSFASSPPSIRNDTKDDVVQSNQNTSPTKTTSSSTRRQIPSQHDSMNKELLKQLAVRYVFIIHSCFLDYGSFQKIHKNERRECF